MVAERFTMRDKLPTATVIH